MHPHKKEHEADMKGKLHKIVGEDTRHESPYKKAERIAGCGIDHLPMPKPTENKTD